MMVLVSLGTFSAGNKATGVPSVCFRLWSLLVAVIFFATEPNPAPPPSCLHVAPLHRFSTSCIVVHLLPRNATPHCRHVYVSNMRGRVCTDAGGRKCFCCGPGVVAASEGRPGCCNCRCYAQTSREPGNGERACGAVALPCGQWMHSGSGDFPRFA